MRCYVKLDTSLQTVCPKCGGTTIKPIGNGQYSCGSKDPNNNNKQCNHFFTPHNHIIGKRVKIRKPMSCWDGLKGTIEEIIVNPKCPIRVKFKQGKSVMSDLFHPVHLEEI